MRVSASMVIYNTDMGEVLHCIECLLRNGIYDIWVVDNSPKATDIYGIVGAKPMLAKGRLRYIHRGDNPGYGAAHNCAIREAEAEGFEAHLAVNTDIVFEPGVVGRLVEQFECDSEIGQISPRIISPDGTQQYAQRLLPTPYDVFGRRFLPRKMMAGRNRRYMLTERDDAQVADIPYHQGSFMLFRMEALREVGGFDERYFMYPEDIDITRRIHSKYKTIYYPGVSVVHDHRASSYRSMKMLWVHCRNMIKYFNKWGWWIDMERRRVNRATLEAMGMDRKGRRVTN